jgi:hypothetical protein
MAGVRPVTPAAHSRTADAPHPRKGTAEPSKGGRTPVPRLPRSHRSCAAIPAITTPSRALHRHPRRCGGTRRQDTATPAVVRPTASRQRHPRVSMQTATDRASPTLPPSKLLLDGYRARHDVPPEARFARTAVYSTTLYAIPPHVDKTVRHTCKLPSPWPIKGGAVP